MTASIALPSRLDSAAAPALAEQFLSVRGSPIEVDASNVAFLGALGIQVLVAAQKQWVADEHNFVLTGATDQLNECCRVLGVPLDSIGSDSASEEAQ